MNKSLIFDLDGTLWDTIDTIVVAWGEVLKKHGLPKIENLKGRLPGTMGMPASEFGPIFFPDLGEENIKNLTEDVCQKECEIIRQKGGRLYDGVAETLPLLAQKYTLYIVSNCQAGYIEAFLDYYTELKPLFKDWECFGNTGKSKGENLRQLIARNHLMPVAFVGDKDSDADAALENQLPFVWAEYGFGKNVHGWKWKIQAIRKLSILF